MGFQRSGFRVQGLVFRVPVLGFKFQDIHLEVYDVDFGFEFKEQAAGF
jgi:hypothetical protein